MLLRIIYSTWKQLVAGKNPQRRFVKGDMERILFKLPLGILGTGRIITAAAITDQRKKLLVDTQQFKKCFSDHLEDSLRVVIS
jgi:hypothetical protein